MRKKNSVKKLFHNVYDSIEKVLDDLHQLEDFIDKNISLQTETKKDIGETVIIKTAERKRLGRPKSTKMKTELVDRRKTPDDITKLEWVCEREGQNFSFKIENKGEMVLVSNGTEQIEMNTAVLKATVKMKKDNINVGPFTLYIDNPKRTSMFLNCCLKNITTVEKEVFEPKKTDTSLPIEETVSTTATSSAPKKQVLELPPEGRCYLPIIEIGELRLIKNETTIEAFKDPSGNKNYIIIGKFPIEEMKEILNFKTFPGRTVHLFVNEIGMMFFKDGCKNGKELADIAEEMTRSVLNNFTELGIFKTELLITKVEHKIEKNISRESPTLNGINGSSVVKQGDIINLFIKVGSEVARHNVPIEFLRNFMKYTPQNYEAAKFPGIAVASYPFILNRHGLLCYYNKELGIHQSHSIPVVEFNDEVQLTLMEWVEWHNTKRTGIISGP